nr:MAG TPA: hypothetical protein [Caudoviricetes sp.]
MVCSRLSETALFRGVAQSEISVFKCLVFNVTKIWIKTIGCIFR